MSKIIYIAGKMADVPDYVEKFGRAQEYLEDMGYIVLNPAVLPKGMPADRYMPICLSMLCQADEIFMLDNAVFSKGAKLERTFAEYQGKPVKFTRPEITLLDRYESVMKRLDHKTLLAHPEKDKLKKTTDLKTKVELLEDIADNLERQGLI